MTTIEKFWNAIKTTLLGLGFVAIIFGALAIGGYCDTRYTQVAEVLDVTPTETLFIDPAGYVWAVSDTDYHKGQFVKLYFFNNTTDYTREDDEILKVKPLDN